MRTFAKFALYMAAVGAALAACTGAAPDNTESVAPSQDAGAAALAWSPTTSAGTYDFGPVDGVGGKHSTLTFTLTNSGVLASGKLEVVLSNTSGTAFSITSNGCKARSLAPGAPAGSNGRPPNSCDVTVEYAPTKTGETDSATLSASGPQVSPPITLTLKGQGGTPYLTLSPGAPQTPSPGTNYYTYDFGLVGSGITDTQTFTVKNIGTGTSNTLQLADLNTRFTLLNDNTSGSQLAPGGTSTFTIKYLKTCTSAFGLTDTSPLFVKGGTQPNSPNYIIVNYSAKCVPAVTTVTAALSNSVPICPDNPSPAESCNLAGTVTVTAGSSAITFSTPQTLSIEQKVIFSSQPDAVYVVSASTYQSTSGSLTAAYNGTTSSTATTTFPQFVSIGTPGQPQPIGAGGTLKNVSISPYLHGFTMQIPFSITGLTNPGFPTPGSALAASLLCDMSAAYMASAGGTGSCSVTDNVLTVTQNFASTVHLWTPGFAGSPPNPIRYVSVGANLPPSESCCAYVTWGTPVVIGAN